MVLHKSYQLTVRLAHGSFCVCGFLKICFDLLQVMDEETDLGKLITHDASNYK